MRKPEQLLWDAMRRAAPGSGEVWLQRVENSMASGMPDVFVTPVYNLPVWVELKCAIAPARDSTAVFRGTGLNPEQVNWHLKFFLMGGTSYIIGSVKGGLGPFLFIVPGKFSREFNCACGTELLSMSLPLHSWKDIYAFWGRSKQN